MSHVKDSENLRFVTQFVDENTGLVELIRHNFPDNINSQDFGIVGLHTCG